MIVAYNLIIVGLDGSENCKIDCLVQSDACIPRFGATYNPIDPACINEALNDLILNLPDWYINVIEIQTNQKK